MKPYDILRLLNMDRIAYKLQSTSKQKMICLKKNLPYKNRIKKKHPAKKHEGINILISTYDGGIGNAVEATPLVATARSLWPNSNITFLTKTPDLFRNWCLIDQIANNTSELQNLVFDKTFISYYGQPRPQKWIHDYNLGEIHYPKIWLNAYFLKSERDYNIDMMKRFGFKGPTPPCYVNIKKPQISLPEDSRKIIAILPCSNNDPKWQTKRWAHYSELMDEILEINTDTSIIIIGSHFDNIERFNESKKILDMRGKLSLDETAWILKNSDFAIGNDCGPAHISCAVGTPTLMLFGSTCIIKNCPPQAISLTSDVCSKKPCQYTAAINTCSKSPNCMTGISVKNVLNTLRAIQKK